MTNDRYGEVSVGYETAYDGPTRAHIVIEIRRTIVGSCTTAEAAGKLVEAFRTDRPHTHVAGKVRVEAEAGLVLVEEARLEAVMRLLVNSGDMTPTAVRQIKACLGMTEGGGRD